MSRDDKEYNLLIGIVLIVAFLSSYYAAVDGFSFIPFLLALLVVALMGILQAWLSRSPKSEYIPFAGLFIGIYLFIYLTIVGFTLLGQSEGFMNFLRLWAGRISAVIEWIFVG
jgi:hypothetical protein